MTAGRQSNKRKPSACGERGWGAQCRTHKLGGMGTMEDQGEGGGGCRQRWG